MSFEHIAAQSISPLAQVPERVSEASAVSLPPIQSITLTSFGPFLDVAVNPSQAVAEHVTSMLQGLCDEAHRLNDADGRGECGGVKGRALPRQVVHHGGLDVSATRVSRYIMETREAIARAVDHSCERDESLRRGGGGGDEDGLNFLLHFGVHNGSGTINVELTGKNCASFRGPDSEGFVCTRCPIAPTSTPRAASAECPPTNVGSDASPRAFYDAAVCHSWDPFVQKGDIFGAIHADYIPEASVQCAVDETNRAMREVAEQFTCRVKSDPSHSSGGGDHAPVALAVSHNAGYYLCNFMLFSSMAMSSEANALLDGMANAKAAMNTALNDGVVVIGRSKKRYLSLFVHVVGEWLMPAEAQAQIVTPFLLQFMQMCRECHADAV